nr:unnamed protein product [Callosobruchus chinensis]
MESDMGKTVPSVVIEDVDNPLLSPSRWHRGDLELCDTSDVSLSPQDMDDDGGKVVIVGVCAMEKKTQSKPMKEILTRLQEFEYIKVIVFQEDFILQKSVEEWPVCDCLISFHSKGFPLDKAIQYAQLHNPYVINNLHMQYDIQDRRKVYSILGSEGIEIPRYAVLDRDSLDPKHHELVESEDHVEVNGVTFNKPFVEKPVSAEDHNIYIYYPTSAGGGSQRLFRKIGSRSSVYSPESRVRKTGSFIYEDFMPTDGTDVKVYTVGPDYAHAEARKSPALDGKVERDREGKEIRYPVILSNAEKLISRKVCLAFKQAVCGFDLLRANGKSFVCDVNGFSFVKNSNKYYDDCAKILGNMILRELAPTLHIPWSVPFQLDDPPIVPTTFGKMMELRCVVAVIRHGDRTPKQKMKVEVRHPKFFEIFEKYDGYKNGHVKLKRPKQLQEILDIARSLLAEIQQHEADPEIEEKQGKLEQLKAVLEMYGHFSGINRKVQMKYQPKGRPRGSSSDDVDKPAEPSLVLILKWGGELTPAGRIQAEELGRIFRCMYPGGQGEYAGAQGLGLLRLHSTFRHDLKIYASDEGRVQMTAAAFAKGLLALEGELTPILVQMVKSANTNGLLDNDCDSSKYQNMCKARLHELMQLDRDFTAEDREKINPCHSSSIADALEFVKNPVKCCKHVHELIKNLMEIVQVKKEDMKTKDAILYHGETWELMGRRWGKIEKDFFTKNKNFDISKIPDIYDCIKYDLQHNQHTLQFEQAEELYTYAKYLADIVIPQVTKDEQWRRAMEYISMVSELNYMSQIVIMLYEDPTKDPCSEERFHIELHFSPGVNCCVQKNLPPGPGFRPHSRNESAASKNCSLNTSATETPEDPKSQCSPRIDEEAETFADEDKYILNPPKVLESPPSTSEFTPPDSPESAYRQYLKSSHTVSGHEAMHLAKRLNEELANQAQHGGRSYGTNRSASPEPEQRSRSYDHKSPQKGKDVPFRASITSRDHHSILDSVPASPIEVPIRTVTPEDHLILDSCSFTPIPNQSEVDPMLGSSQMDLDSAQVAVSELMHSTDGKCNFLMELEIEAIQKSDFEDLAPFGNKQRSSVLILYTSDDIETPDESKLSTESNNGSKLSLPFDQLQNVTESENISSEITSNLTSRNDINASDLSQDSSSENLNVDNECSDFENTIHSSGSKASEFQKADVYGASQVPTNRYDLPFAFDMSEFSPMSGSLEVELGDLEFSGNAARSDISSMPSNDASIRTDTPQDTFTSTYDHSELSFISGPYELDPNDLESQRLALGANIHSSSPQSCRCKTECYVFDRPELSPISGSLDMDPSDLDSLGNARKSERSSAASSRPLSATNELPLTELNLALFTSKLENNSSSIMSTNELPLSDIRFGKFRRQSTLDSQKDDLSLEVNWDTDVNKMDESLCRVVRESRHRSFSDPNILDGSTGRLSDKHFLLKKYNDSLFEQTRNQLPVPPSLACYPYSFYPEHAPEAGCPVCRYRGGGRAALGFPHSPPPSLVVTTSTTTCMSSSADCGQAGVVSAPGVCGQGKRHRHSIAGQMSYFKMLGFGCGGPIGLKKLVGGSANSLFSTAVISGSSSAPNLRDMISNTSSATESAGRQLKLRNTSSSIVLPCTEEEARIWRREDSLNVDNLAKIFPTAPGLDQDLGNVGMLLDSFDRDSSSSALELSDYCSGIIQAQDSGDTGDITPVSCSSEAEFNTIDATAESASTTDVTVTEEIITTITADNMDPDETITTARLNAVFISKDNVPVLENNLFQSLSAPKSLSPLNSNINVYTNVLHSPTSEFVHLENEERSQPSSSRAYDFDLKNFIKKSNYDKDISNRSININSTCGDKWCTNKEKFLENKHFSKTDNIDFGKNLNIHKDKKVDKDVELKKITPASMGISITKSNPTDKSASTSSMTNSICDSDDCLNDSSNEQESSSDTNVNVSDSSSNLSTVKHVE